MSITPQQVYELCTRSQTHHQTATKWLHPELRAHMKPSVRARIEKAARELGIEIPPSPAMEKAA